MVPQWGVAANEVEMLGPILCVLDGFVWYLLYSFFILIFSIFFIADFTLGPDVA